ncbi:MAG: aminotransferase class I/II-fold pyridoxal phosphate-dependent enzyme [candidate division Zixibacteria bacterium]|nr:aminotransferase class I/II-fold pyridoxal phosphate-dependent enzyme [candidate division Zixibacteria bacterium]
MIKIPKHIETLRPYIAGKMIEEFARERNLSRIVKLASNENPLGPSPKAIEAVRQSLDKSFRYVDPGAYDLVRAIGERIGRPTEQIVCGAGTDALLSYIVKAFTGDGDEVITADGTFIGIYVSVRKHNRTLVTVPLKDYSFDLDAIAARIGDRTRIVYLANPNNPTGTMFTSRQFESFMAKVPSNVLVVLDEAYFSYAESHPQYPDGLKYDFDNLIVTRTFSKDYGLAGFRVGYACGPEYLIREIYKVRLAFEPSYPAQVAATAALGDEAFLRTTVDLNGRMLEKMRTRFEQLGIVQIPSVANFILMLFPSASLAEQFNAGCLDRGLIVRHVAGFGIPNGIRMNSGTEDETEFALEVIEKVHAGMMASASVARSAQS